jgi:hypothetical protein
MRPRSRFAYGREWKGCEESPHPHPRPSTRLRRNGFTAPCACHGWAFGRKSPPLVSDRKALSPPPARLAAPPPAPERFPAVPAGSPVAFSPQDVSRQTPTTKILREAFTEFQAPAADGLVGNDHTTLRQDEFDISPAQTENMIQADRMTDDLAGEAMTVMWIGGCFHPAIMVCFQPVRQSRLP